jgi:hypothetical protein
MDLQVCMSYSSPNIPDATKMAEKVSPNPIEVAAEELLVKSWSNAVERTKVSPSSVEKATVLGVNICVKIPEVFAAAFDTVKAGGSVVAAIALPVVWPLAVWESYCAARSVFSALVEDMTPLGYVTVVVLATHKEGIEEEGLAKEVEAFVKDPDTGKFSWYLGMSGEKVYTAGRDIYPGWIHRKIDELDSKGFVDIVKGKLFPKSKNVEWKFGF